MRLFGKVKDHLGGGGCRIWRFTVWLHFLFNLSLPCMCLSLCFQTVCTCIHTFLAMVDFIPSVMLAKVNPFLSCFGAKYRKLNNTQSLPWLLHTVLLMNSCLVIFLKLQFYSVLLKSITGKRTSKLTTTASNAFLTQACLKLEESSFFSMKTNIRN